MFEDLDMETVEDILEAPEPPLDREETTIVYLDQKIRASYTPAATILTPGTPTPAKSCKTPSTTVTPSVPTPSPASWKPTPTMTRRSNGSSTS